MKTVPWKSVLGAFSWPFAFSALTMSAAGEESHSGHLISFNFSCDLVSSEVYLLEGEFRAFRSVFPSFSVGYSDSDKATSINVYFVDRTGENCMTTASVEGSAKNLKIDPSELDFEESQFWKLGLREFLDICDDGKYPGMGLLKEISTYTVMPNKNIAFDSGKFIGCRDLAKSHVAVLGLEVDEMKYVLAFLGRQASILEGH